MNGMHIIRQVQTSDSSSPLAIICVVIGIAICIGSFLIFHIRNKKREKDIGHGTLMFGYFIGVLIMFCACFISTKSKQYIYTCTFDDKVTANEITKKFTVIKVEDDVWTIKNKNKKE